MRTSYYITQAITAIVVVAAAQRSEIVDYLSDIFPSAEIVIPAGIFMLLSQSLMRIDYWPPIFKRFNRKSYLGGCWIYGLHNRVSGDRLYGTFIIQYYGEDVRIVNGAVWYHETPPTPEMLRGTWFSSHTSCVDDEIAWVFNMPSLRTKDDKFEDVRGNILLQIRRDNGIPTSLHGHFVDSGSRAGQYGTIVAERVTDICRSEASKVAYERYGYHKE